LHYDDVLKVITGSDAVIDAVGGDEASTIRSQAIGNITRAMQAAHVSRVIALGGSGILRVGPWRFSQLPVFPNGKKLVTKEHEKVHQALLASNLAWTQICPSFMVEGPKTGRYKTRIGHPFLLWRQTIRLADIADFAVKELQRNEYVGKQVALIN